MKIQPQKQPNSLACGPMCIYLVTKYFGGNITFSEIEKLTDYKKKEGVTDHDIVRTCKKLGYRAKRYLNSSWQDLKKHNTKDKVLIVSWMLNGYIGHVSIVDAVTKDAIYLIDTEKGERIKMEKMQFMRLWMEYDDLDWPRKSSDIHLRPLIVIEKGR